MRDEQQPEQPRTRVWWAPAGTPPPSERRDPTLDVDPPDPDDDGLTQADRDREADRAADRYERGLWGDR